MSGDPSMATRANTVDEVKAISQDHLNSVDEASKRFGVSQFTTRRLIKAGFLKAVRVSKRVMVPESEVRRVISEGCGKRPR